MCGCGMGKINYSSLIRVKIAVNVMNEREHNGQNTYSYYPNDKIVKDEHFSYRYTTFEAIAIANEYRGRL